MRRVFIALLISTLLVGALGCASMNKTEKGAVVGATAGAILGAVIGDAAGNTAAGVIIGAAVGGADRSWIQAVHFGGERRSSRWGQETEPADRRHRHRQPGVRLRRYVIALSSVRSCVLPGRSERAIALRASDG